jgi:hypothetical protein
MKISSSGVIQWQKSMYGESFNAAESYSVAVDSSKNVYVCGYAYAGGATAANKIQLVKYNSSGTIQWQKKVTDGYGGYNCIGRSIVTDSNSNFYTAGEVYAGVKAYFGKFDSSGVAQWQREFGTSSGSIARQISLDSNGNVFVCGFSGSSGLDSFHIVKYNNSGTSQWQKRLTANPYAAYGVGCGCDSLGNINIVGYPSNTGVCVAQYDTNGYINWQRLIGAGTVFTPGNMAVDAGGNIYICAYGSTLSNILIAKYDSSGVIQWQRTLSVPAGSPYGVVSISVDNSGSYYINSVLAAGLATIAKLPIDGSKTGTYTISGVSVTYAASSYTDAAANLVSSEFFIGGTASHNIDDTTNPTSTPTQTISVTTI